MVIVPVLCPKVCCQSCQARCVLDAALQWLAELATCVTAGCLEQKAFPLFLNIATINVTCAEAPGAKVPWVIRTGTSS